MKASIYARVSTDQQDVNNQIEQLKAWAGRRGWEVVYVYQEAASAWKAGHQIELAQLYTDARRGEFDVVLVWALDRLSREGALGILKLIQRFKQCGVRIFSLQESWTEAPGELAEVLFAIVGWVARMESERRSERTKAGMERLKREGKLYHRPIGIKETKKRRPKRVRQTLGMGVYL